MEGLIQILNAQGYSLQSLQRIECYDISNTQGTNPTASMVVLTNGEIDKSQYRKFKILTKGPNDFAMIQEVLKRRLKHTEWHLPNLLIVDGGKGQVSSALKILQEQNINIPLIGLAKREETIILPVITKKENYVITSETKQSLKCPPLSLREGTTKQSLRTSFIEVSLPKNTTALHLIMRVRDEAHRFAITYHRKLRTKFGIFKN
jgi:excinuclease ABC subunit C